MKKLLINLWQHSNINLVNFSTWEEYKIVHNFDIEELDDEVVRKLCIDLVSEWHRNYVKHSVSASRFFTKFVAPIESLVSTKVSLFRFDGEYYVIPYLAKVSTDRVLVKAASEFVKGYDVEEYRQGLYLELNAYATGNFREVTTEDAIDVLTNLWILSHDVSHIKATSDKTLGKFPTISSDILKVYDEEWDGGFMFPHCEGVEDGVIKLVIKEDSSS